ncbi:MAG: hypothetical protein OQJ81_02340, partial [Melioribacteraceae bacterium]|nr:hypothetical protein [Melioribacteraceae bacterium]
KSVENNLENSSNIYKLLGNVNYRTTYQNSESSISLKFRPEIFGKGSYALKFGAQGDYVYRTSDIAWKTFITYQNFEYSLNNDKYNFSSFNIITGGDFILTENTPAQVFVGYSYQDIEFINNVNSDFIYLDAKLQNYVSNYSSVSYGVFIENFISEGISNITSKPLEAKGWFYGPQISFNYLKTFLFNLGYKFLLLNSDDLQNPSFEHRVNALGGMKLNKDFSIFMYIDFYFRQAKQKRNATETLSLLPTKNENHIMFKINYKLENDFSIYIKSGYFRENILSDSKNLEGLNFLLGLELKN